MNSAGGMLRPPDKGFLPFSVTKRIPKMPCRRPCFTLTRTCQRFRRSCKFSTWITAIGINAALTVIRKKKSRRESDTELYSPDEPVWHVTDQAPDPERRLVKAQIILLLRKELLSLPPKMLEVVTNYYGDDSSQQDAADRLGISLAAVKSRLLRGRRSLRLSLEEKGLLDAHV